MTIKRGPCPNECVYYMGYFIGMSMQKPIEVMLICCMIVCIHPSQGCRYTSCSTAKDCTCPEAPYCVASDTLYPYCDKVTIDEWQYGEGGGGEDNGLPAVYCPFHSIYAGEWHSLLIAE